MLEPCELTKMDVEKKLADYREMTTMEKETHRPDKRPQPSQSTTEYIRQFEHKEKTAPACAHILSYFLTPGPGRVYIMDK